MELTAGQKATRATTFTGEHLKSYAKITEDYNPLHIHKDFASKTPFKRLLIQGGITTGLLHALVAMDMPGPGSPFLNQNWQFIARCSSMIR